MRMGDAAIDVALGEDFSFKPMIAGVDLNPTADPERLAISQLRACWSAPARVDGEARFQRATTQPRIEAMRDLFPQGVKQGDRFLRKREGTWWEVQDFDPDSQALRYRMPVRLIVP